MVQSAWRAVIVHTDGHHHDRCEPTIVRRWQRAQDAGTRHRLPSVASVWQRVDSRSDGWRWLHTVSGWRVHVQVCVWTRALKYQHVGFSHRQLVTHTLHRDLSHWCSRHGASDCVQWQGRRLNICRILERVAVPVGLSSQPVAAVTTTIRRGNSVPSPPHRSWRGHCCNGGARGFRGCCHPTGSMQ